MRDVGQHRAHARRIGIQRLVEVTPRVRQQATSTKPRSGLVKKLS